MYDKWSGPSEEISALEVGAKAQFVQNKVTHTIAHSAV